MSQLSSMANSAFYKMKRTSSSLPSSKALTSHSSAHRVHKFLDMGRPQGAVSSGTQPAQRRKHRTVDDNDLCVSNSYKLSDFSIFGSQMSALLELETWNVGRLKVGTKSLYNQSGNSLTLFGPKESIFKLAQDLKDRILKFEKLVQGRHDMSPKAVPWFVHSIGRCRSVLDLTKAFTRCSVLFANGTTSFKFPRISLLS